MKKMIKYPEKNQETPPTKPNQQSTHLLTSHHLKLIKPVNPILKILNQQLKYLKQPVALVKNI